MTAPRTSPLLTITGGASGPSVLLLHDRYKDLDELKGLDLPADFRTIQARSARTQMSGTEILGYFWFLGPPERPELTTFGDGLHHLESLLLDVSTPGERCFIVGKGEGGVMALTLGTVWPDRLAGVISIDGPLPLNIDAFPLDPQPLAGLPVLLIEEATDLSRTAAALTDRGASVELRGSGDGETKIAEWLSRHRPG